MPNPVLKKLRKPGLTAGELAHLLEKHIGPGSNDVHCEEAIDALVQVRDSKIRGVAQVVGILMGSNAPPCERIRDVISQLRSDVWK